MSFSQRSFLLAWPTSPRLPRRTRLHSVGHGTWTSFIKARSDAADNALMARRQRASDDSCDSEGTMRKECCIIF